MFRTQNNTRIALYRGTESKRKRERAGPCLPSLAVLFAPVPVAAVEDQHLLHRTASYKGRNLGRRKGMFFFFSPLGEAAALVMRKQTTVKEQKQRDVLNNAQSTQ